jgi:hypothetical protein
VPPPAEALLEDVLPEPNRKDFFNRRRREDPLGEGQPCTWRSRLIKVACEVFLNIRRVVVKLASSWPHLDELSRTGTPVAATKTSGSPPATAPPWARPTHIMDDSDNRANIPGQRFDACCTSRRRNAILAATRTSVSSSWVA